MDCVNFNKIKNLLIITSSGGSGHLNAAAAIEANAKQSHNLKIKKVDLLRDLLVGNFGNLLAKRWDQALKTGALGEQIFLGQITWLADILFAMPIFLKTLILLWKYEIDHIVDTQALGTMAIVRAAYMINITNAFFRKNQPKITVSKIMTDLPTDKALHFFHSIKKLAKKRQIFELVTTKPLLKDGESEEDFWKTHCNLTMKQIRYANFPLRPAFIRFENSPLMEKPVCLELKFNSEEEFHLIKVCSGKDQLEYSTKNCGKKVIQKNIQENDHVFSLMLGSQAVVESTLQYVENKIQWVRQSGQKDCCYHLFVFCSQHIPGQNTLFKKVCNLVVQTEDFPKNLHVVPLAFQDDTELAPILFRSDHIIIRTGGMTVMEVLKVFNGKIFIHSEAKDHTKECTQNELLNGIALWEAGNAEYLIKMKNATVVTPWSISKALCQVHPQT